MHPLIPTLNDDQAPPAARPILAQLQRALGKAPNLHRTLAHAPAALRAYVDSVRALAGGTLAPGLREQIAVATAGHNKCAYCASAHTMLGEAAGVDAGELRRNLAGESSDARTEAALAFVRRLIDARGDLPADEVQKLRDAGFADAEIVEIVAHVGVNWFTNVFNVLMRTEVDFPLVSLAAAS